MAIKEHGSGEALPPEDFDNELEGEDGLTTRVTEVRATLPEQKPRDRATLTVFSGPDTGRVHSLKDEVTLGRGRQCTIPLDDSSVSREHARIVLSPDGIRWLIDLESRNGTYVDGLRIERHQLHDGDRVQIGPVVQFRYAVTDDAEERVLRELYESSVRDPLTGVFNRKHLGERLQSELAFALRHGTELSMLLIDIDHFKRVNDTWGHLAGDHVLKTLGRVVGRTIRTEDVFARYGGEEFAIVARDIDAAGAMAMAERVRKLVQNADYTFQETRIQVTVSIGVATLRCCGTQRTAEQLIGVADRRLYAAKEGGRNRVVGPD